MKNLQPIRWTRSLIAAAIRLVGVTCLLVLVGVALPTVGVPLLLSSWLSPTTPNAPGAHGVPGGILGDMIGRVAAMRRPIQDLPNDDKP